MEKRVEGCRWCTGGRGEGLGSERREREGGGERPHGTAQRVLPRRVLVGEGACRESSLNGVEERAEEGESSAGVLLLG
eukprot:3305288-Pleurochrysis_carterae.AAC.1